MPINVLLYVCGMGVVLDTKMCRMSCILFCVWDGSGAGCEDVQDELNAVFDCVHQALHAEG